MKKIVFFLFLTFLLTTPTTSFPQETMFEAVSFIAGGRVYKIKLYADRFVINDTTYTMSTDLWTLSNGVISPSVVTNRVAMTNGAFIYPGSGDIDGSGTLSGLDGLYLLLYLSGKILLTDLQKSKADINGDGRLTFGDYILITGRSGSPQTGTIFTPDTTRYFLASTLTQTSPGKVRLASISPCNNGTSQVFDVEAGGSLRIPRDNSLYFGATTYTLDPDSVMRPVSYTHLTLPTKRIV